MADAAALRRHLYPLGDDRGSEPGRRDVEHFLVTSWGHSGSIWLAGSLNLHPRVCATVGIDNPIETFRYYALNRDAAALAAQAGPALARHGFSVWESAAMTPIRALPAMRGLTAIRRDPDRLPWYVFDELELIPADPPYIVLGNVHGITLSALHGACAAQPDIFRGRRVLLCDLIRHPVGRTESAVKATLTHHLPALAPRITAFIHEHAQECLQLERRYHIDFQEPRARAALHVFRQGLQNDVWAGEIRRFPDVYRILLERLQTDPDYFAHTFATLAQGRVAPDAAFLDRVFAPGNLGSGRQTPTESGRPPGPREQYEQWSAFERDEFARVAERLGLPAVYFPYGYDFSFVARTGPGYRTASWFDAAIGAEATLD